MTYRFRVLLPEHLHPSYSRGTGARFFYMVTITIGSKHQHIPLTVLSKGFLGACCPYSAEGGSHSPEIPSVVPAESL